MAIATGRADFTLAGFSEVPELQALHATLFLLIYVVSLGGNALIVMLTSLSQRLSTPMYFFLKHLSLLDAAFISVTVPNSIANSITRSRTISFLGCATQLFLVLYLAFSELVLLTVMAGDRYVAICYPLRYELIMSRMLCARLAVASWLSGGLCGGLYTASTFSLTFCSFLVQQFFCDVPSLLKLACAGTQTANVVITAAIFVLAVGCFVSITVSYTYIFHTVLRIPSAQGRSKAFSTCLPHLFVTTLFVSSGSAPYLMPKSSSPCLLDLLLSVFYTVVPPTLNPVIYSLRNKDIKDALLSIISGKSTPSN